MLAPVFNRLRGEIWGGLRKTHPVVWRCDTIGSMRWALVGLLFATGLWGQDDFHVYRDAPRLSLTAQRLRLLERERERASPRWQAFEALLESGAPMPEPGFAWALDYRVSHQNPAGRKAIEWALANGDLRQIALVYDWCIALASKAEADRLAAKLQEGLGRPATDMPGQNARALAAIALADRLPDSGDGALREIVGWWRGQKTFAREDLYPLFEFLHAIRDNTKIDLRESAGPYFDQLPLDYVAGFYPAPFPGPENDFQIPVYAGGGDPDISRATWARAGGLAMVAFDTNAVNYQYAQGMLMADRFAMRGALGAPYEFLWANPYQPGLAYQMLPLVFHDPATGHVFARTSWDEDATWVGYFDGSLQMFRDGGRQVMSPQSLAAPLRMGDAVLLVAKDPEMVRAHIDARAMFVLGLRPLTEYGVEIDDEELDFLSTDVGGTLVVRVSADADAEVLIRRHALN